MLALTLIPGKKDSIDLTEVPEPERDEGEVLVKTLGVGICGTDREIISGDYGVAPEGQERLVLGHESIGQVLECPRGSGLAPGDLVVGIVRHPDPVPCENCAVGEWDMCRNGRFSERGIQRLDGFCAERYRSNADFLIKVDPALGRLGVLVEPTSILAKAWEHLERIGHRAHWRPRRVFVTGAGPIGLLAALLGRQKDYDVHVFARVREGLKPELVSQLGATYHAESLREIASKQRPDIILECTGAGTVVLDAIECLGPDGVACLAGVSSGHRVVPVDTRALNRELVLENHAVFGSVNANRRHYEAAVRALVKTDRRWLERLICRHVPLAQWREALEPRERNEIKTVLEL
jgi:threonine dehydrogenase-like Zn-dependent dehydrogenase